MSSGSFQSERREEIEKHLEIWREGNEAKRLSEVVRLRVEKYIRDHWISRTVLKLELIMDKKDEWLPTDGRKPFFDKAWEKYKE